MPSVKFAEREGIKQRTNISITLPYDLIQYYTERSKAIGKSRSLLIAEALEYVRAENEEEN